MFFWKMREWYPFGYPGFCRSKRWVIITGFHHHTVARIFGYGYGGFPSGKNLRRKDLLPLIEICEGMKCYCADHWQFAPENQWLEDVIPVETVLFGGHVFILTFNYWLLLGRGTTQYRGLFPGSVQSPKLRNYPKMLIMLLSLRKMPKRSRLPKMTLRLQMSEQKIWIIICFSVHYHSLYTRRIPVWMVHSPTWMADIYGKGM